jgi:hypothetical protein
MGQRQYADIKGQFAANLLRSAHQCYSQEGKCEIDALPMRQEQAVRGRDRHEG